MSLQQILLLLNTMAIFGVLVYLVILTKNISRIKNVLSEFSEEIRKEFLPAVRLMKEASEKICTISSTFGKGTEQAGNFLESVENAGNSLRNIVQSLQKDYEPFIKTLIGLWYGFKTANRIMEDASNLPAGEADPTGGTDGR